MKKVNWKRLNAALWTEIVLAYLLPFQVVDGFQYKVGFPIPFLTVYDVPLQATPLATMALYPLSLLLNAVILYGVFTLCLRLYHKVSTD